jgi:hypothetical protein
LSKVDKKYRIMQIKIIPQYSILNGECSMFNIQYSILNNQYSIFNAQCILHLVIANEAKQSRVEIRKYILKLKFNNNLTPNPSPRNKRGMQRKNLYQSPLLLARRRGRGMRF